MVLSKDKTYFLTFVSGGFKKDHFLFLVPVGPDRALSPIPLPCL
jgi:hypothetical protein